MICPGLKEKYFINLIGIHATKEKISTTEISRRGTTLKYHLKVEDKLIPVCKKMFMSTLSLKERSVLSWDGNSAHGMSKTRISNTLNPRQSKDKGVSFLRTLLESLNKLP